MHVFRYTPGAVAACLFFLVLRTPVALSSGERTYETASGDAVAFPLGDASFADEVASFIPGKPDGGEASADASAVLGIPDRARRRDDSFLTLGCGGSLVVEFVDNTLIDVPGPDMHVFEVGPDVEATALAVSADGDHWIRVGMIAGGKAAVDIGPYVSGDEAFRSVKLVDLRQACNSRTPGADIDAIGAIGAASKIALDSAVLFGSGEHALKSGAHAELDRVIGGMQSLQQGRVEVAGHTDSIGDAQNNIELSRRRARAVAAYLVKSGAFPETAVTVRAHGETRPIASNDTAAGRERNRRVELTVRAARRAVSRSAPAMEILGTWYSESNGIIELARGEDGITGSYTSADGLLFGEFTTEDVFTGYWVKDSSARSCDVPRAGSDHWGHIRMEFESPARDSFVAYWRYCGEESDRGSWHRAERLL